MTTDPTDEKLDRLLQDWSTESVSHSQLSLLQQPIVASLKDSDSAAHSVDGEGPLRDRNAASEASRSVVPTRPRTHSNRGAAGIAVGMVLTVMLATLLLLIQSPGRAASTSESVPEYAWLQHGQIQNKTLVLQEMERLYDRKFLWLAENGNRVERGLAGADSRRSGVADGGDLLAIRSVVPHRTASNLSRRRDGTDLDLQGIRIRLDRPKNGQSRRRGHCPGG